MKFNVIAVLYNSESTLKDLVAGLEENASEIAQVALVDNASTDSSIEIARELADSSSLDIALIENTNDGFAGGHWAARDAFDAPQLPTLCVNPDVLLAPGTLTAMRDVYISLGDTAGVISAPLVGADGLEDSASRRRLPNFFQAAIHATLGRLTPKRWRYNRGQVAEGSATRRVGSWDFTPVEGTTGALMLVSPALAPVQMGIFDRDYFMYGEDLQLCADAKAAGLTVGIVECEPSIHLKGVSSGWPRSWRANKAFHEAMWLYYNKNLAHGALDRMFVRVAVTCRLWLSGLAGALFARGVR